MRHDHLLTLTLCVALACPVNAQVSSIIPRHAQDSLEADDRRHPERVKARKAALDSLAAGRLRWKLAAINEYRLQISLRCFCFSDDSLRGRELALVRDGKIVGRSRGKDVSPYGPGTIDSLFDLVTRDLDDRGRVVEQLRLHPRYGFPVLYTADTPPIMDVRMTILVDSFSVVQRKHPPR
jgi:hypothetical protein